jgi:zinc transport system substrate-binding protein
MKKGEIMKKIIKVLLIVFSGVLMVTGCFKSDSMENIDIVVTKYPIEYAINTLYGDYSKIIPLYPNGIDTNNYELTDKKIKTSAKNDMFIYNGLSEGDTAIKFLNNNSKIKLIDVSKGLEIRNNEEELWLNPSNYLMIAQNLKNDLSEYINSTVILQNIDTNYEKLKLTISTYDAQLNTVAENAKDKNIIVTNDTFKFLERYGFTVYSLEESENYSSAAYNSALTLANEKRISYIFMLEGDQESEKVKKLKDLGLNIVTIQRLGNLSDATPLLLVFLEYDLPFTVNLTTLPLPCA